jgi:DNA (cytosine-5)-methyltransferase 1
LSASLRKFEWQAGRLRSLRACLIQLRPSGVRVKRPNYAPALVAIGQTPILGWERRELSVAEAACLQGFSPTMDFSAQSRTDSLKQLGNAVHVGVAKYVLDSALKAASQLGLEWADSIGVGSPMVTGTR